MIKLSGEPSLGLAMLVGAKELHRGAEQRGAGGGDPTVPGPVADHGDVREAAAIADVPTEIAEQARRGPAGKAAHVEHERDGRRPAPELGGEGGLEAPVVLGAEAAG